MTGPCSAGMIIGGRYNVSRFVGEGGMQFVYAAQDKILGREIALKTPKNSSAEKRFLRSAIVSARVNHPNVAKTLDYIEENGRPYLVEEYVDGADLDKALLTDLKHLDPYLAARVFHYLARGLAASHHVGVVHRDLKPTNVMVADAFQLGALKITDFGIAKMADEEIAEAVEGGDAATITSSQTAVGALPYMAPEAIETPRKVGTPADVWSIGAMMFQLLTGSKPFGSGFQAVNKILAAQPVQVPPFVTNNAQFRALSTDLMGIVQSCLQRGSDKRPSADKLVELCGSLCYPVAPRYTGTVRQIHYNAWGFIATSQGDVFFNLKSAYGEKPREGDKVLFSKFQGGGAWRAHPVIKLQG